MLAETTQLRTDPNVVDFGIGQPQLDLLPRDMMAKSAQFVLSQPDNAPLNYGHPKGDGLMRESLAQFLGAHYGGRIDPAGFITTNGASMALHLIANLFAEAGDTVLVEEPTYFLAYQIFADRGLKVVSVPVGDVKELEKAAKKHKPAFFYTIPVFQNPTGKTLSLQQREAILGAAEKFDFLIVADEVYQLLSYTVTPPPPFASRVDSGRVLSVGSFSKIMAPGLRLGWIQTCSTLQDKLLSYGLFKSGGGLNPLVCRVVHGALSQGWQAQYLDRLRRIFRHRVEVMDRCLREQLGDLVSYERPDGGYFFWLQFPEELEAEKLSKAAEREKVGFRGGERFSNQSGFRNFARLSFAHYDENAISVGVDRLARAVRSCL